MAVIYYFFVGKLKMKKSKALKVIFAILLAVLVIGGVCVFAFYKYFTAPIGKYPDKAQRAEFIKHPSVLYNDGEGRFYNENTVESTSSSSLNVNGYSKPESLIPAEKIDSLDRASGGEMNISWLGHSSVLVQMGSQNVLIDPILTKGATTPQMYTLPARISEIALDIDNIPDIDVLCISHDHFDHLDYGTVTAIDSKVGAYVVPLGVDSLLKGWGIDESKIHVLGWWESVELGGVTYTLTPAQHYSGRFASKQYKTLWGGIYMSDSAHSLYFTGDSGYCGTFADIYDKLGAPDVMLADAGQDTPAWSHMSPEEVTQAAQDVHAAYLIPVHWGAYLYSNYDWYKPAEDIVKQADEDGVAIATPKLGHLFSYDEIADQNEKWWEENE